jgi:hypothetical protein
LAIYSVNFDWSPTLIALVVNMRFTQIEVVALFTGIAAAQTLNIPTAVGNVTALPEPSAITGSEDYGNREFDRGHPCDSDEDTGSSNAVFILEDGASISNVIIGANSLEGVHCKGSSTSHPDYHVPD